MKDVSWLAAAGLAGWGAARLAGAERCRPLEAPLAPLLAFTPHATAAALVGSLLLPRKRAAATAALTGTALSAVVLPRAARRPQPRAAGPVLRVITVNLLAGRASAEAIAGLVRRKAADVLFLQELTEPAADSFKQAGLADVLPYQMTDLRGDTTCGSGIYARFPLSVGLHVRPTHAAQPTARVELPDGQAADLICVHSHSPNPPLSRAKVARWREELGVLPPPADPAASPADPPRVLAGDFNATLDHVHFRRLLRQGHADAAAQLGSGLIPTWAPWGTPSLITIDHVLVDPRCAVLAVSVHPVPGSDHRAVYAEFRLPARGGRTPAPGRHLPGVTSAE